MRTTRHAARLLTIWVPATSANLGPGFDSVGLALAFGLTVEVFPADGRWSVELTGDDLLGLPTGEDNLIVGTALAVAGRHGAELPSCRLAVKSEIPLARGLGSSAAAIVSGVMLANELGRLRLTGAEFVSEAARVEGHPDNVAPAILGGLVIGAQAPSCAQAPPFWVAARFPPAEVVLCIPDDALKTETARAALPAYLPFADAVRGSAASNVLVAALLCGDWGTAGEMMRHDVFHECFRQGLLPDFPSMRDLAYRHGAYGAALSGAGPTLIAFAPSGRAAALAEAFRRDFPRFETRITSASRRGARVSRHRAQVS